MWLLLVIACWGVHTGDSNDSSPDSSPPPEPVCVSIPQIEADRTSLATPSGYEYCTVPGQPGLGYERRVASVAYVGDQAAWYSTTMCGDACAEGLVCVGGATEPSCRTPCASDADCDADSICVIPGALPDDPRVWVGFGPVCVPTACRTAADCEGDPCVVTHGQCDSAATSGGSAACPTSADECRSASDCDPGNFCQYDVAAARFTCHSQGSCE